MAPVSSRRLRRPRLQLKYRLAARKLLHTTTCSKAYPISLSSPQLRYLALVPRIALHITSVYLYKFAVFPSLQDLRITYHAVGSTEEMVRGLQQVSWRKVDVSFHSALWPFLAHNAIHVSYRNILVHLLILSPPSLYICVRIIRLWKVIQIGTCELVVEEDEEATM